ncbi:MAG: Flp pilus assembly complex ATPase component TadA [Planctomycetes bacterium]|nr:Flp pilus assembly complex ATPase component TadA [Planctomycetota bacterium]
MSALKTKKPFGEIVIEMKLATAAQIKEALAAQKALATGAKPVKKKTGEILVEKNILSASQVTAILAKQANLKFVRISSGTITDEIIKLVPKSLALEHKIMPLQKKGKVLTVAASSPPDMFALDNLRFALNSDIEVVLTAQDELNQAIAKYYGSTIDDYGNLVGDISDIDIAQRDGKEEEAVEDDAPIIRLVHTIISDSVKVRASDIHIEPMEKALRIRYRIDGVCREIESPPKRLQGPVLSRIKLMAGMDIAEKRRPLDGRIATSIDGKDFDIRVSSLPSQYGESIVMRLLEKQSLASLDDLGFHGEDYRRFRSIIKRPHGIFLVTGPTGSGKTTTLYAAIKELNKPNVKIITAEDPVEYVMSGVNQCPAKREIGFTFASIIRAMLRQAPQIILVGEIRDAETATIATQAALTGHLVFSTLHTNDAPSALTRLLDMGVKPFLVAASIQAIMAQRLIRILCPKCKQPYTPEEPELAMLGLTQKDIEGKTIYKAVGCKDCKEGYKGRRGIFELLEMSSTLKEMTFRKEPTVKLYEEAKISGKMTSLMEDGVRKILDGLTTLEEVVSLAKREDIGY